MPVPITVKEPAKLLEHLFAAWPEVKKKQVRTWLKYKSVTVNGRIITQFDHPLKPGDVVAIRNVKFAAPETKLPQSGIRIRFEDADIIVIDKPPKLLTIASEKVKDNTAYFHLTEYLRKGDQFSRERVWIVHRLDRDTSGLMVFAKTEVAKRTLQLGWDKAEKKYFAVVEGKMPKPEGTLRTYLNEDNPGKVYVTRHENEGRLAVTHFRVLKQNSERSLVEVTLETGRRHQIRVQLSEVGCPIVGDDKYRAQTNPIRRVALHACSLKFPHPVTGTPMKFESPLPGDFGELVAAAKKRESKGE